MTEIELKAHVADPAGTLVRIRGFATFSGEVEKLDAYWTRTGGRLTGAQNPASDPHVLFAAASGIFTFIAALAAAVTLILGARKEVALMTCLLAAMIVGVLSFVGWRYQRRSTNAAGIVSPGGNAPIAGATKVRIREERTPTASGRPAKRATTLVTYKRKETRDGIEVNDEREFTVSDRAAFEALLADLGFAPTIEKKKQTKSFSLTHGEGDIPVTIELSLVDRLGWFAEIEILAESPDEAFIARAREALSTILAQCGIPESEIESRYYTDMLAEIGAAPEA